MSIIIHLSLSLLALTGKEKKQKFITMQSYDLKDKETNHENEDPIEEQRGDISGLNNTFNISEEQETRALSSFKRRRSSAKYREDG